MTNQTLRSRNFPPSPALEPYVARHYVLSANAGENIELLDRLLGETPFVRLLLRGDWGAETVPGEWTNRGRTLLFGPNSRTMPVRVRGGFRVVGIALRASAWRALSDVPADRLTDRMEPLADLWGARADALMRDIQAISRDDEQGDAEAFEVLERHVAALIGERGNIEPDPALQRFETIARIESSALVRDIASELGLSQRNFERKCRASFGLSPKAVLRRSRFLDMASAIRGLSNPDDQALAALRYYDQPQLIREFRHFCGMTPKQFSNTPTPLLDAGLELRESRKRREGASR
ncbi:MAG: AraC family transcriptional regulator [Novosphingobium sp.]